MRIRVLLALVAALALLIPMTAQARPGNGGPSDYQVSGGGQVIASTDAMGPGDTIAFVAQRASSEEIGDPEEGEVVNPARGQLQVVARDNGIPASRPQSIFHGIVNCIVPDATVEQEENGEVEGDMARFGGTGRDRVSGMPFDFVVDVIDTGDEERGSDVVRFERFAPSEDSPCETEADNELRHETLARGNVKIHDRRE